MPTPNTVRASDFNDQVYHRLSDKLRQIGASPDQVDIVTADRLSLVLTSANRRAAEGMDKQVALLSDRFSEDADVQSYAQLPSEMFQDGSREPEALDNSLVDRGFRGCWITHNDLYPGQSDKPFAALVLINDQLFVRINSSGATREITKVDGSTHNSAGLLLSSLIRALGRQKILRVSEDPMRFSRDTFAAEHTIEAATARQWSIAFGTMTFSPSDGAASLMTLRSMMQIGQLENDLRSRKIAAHYLSRCRQGLTNLPARQLPPGVIHQRDEHDEPVRRQDAFIPEFDQAMAPIIRDAVKRHAAGESYVNLGQWLAELNVPARGIPNQRHETMGDLLTDTSLSTSSRRERLTWAAKRFFTTSTVEDLPWRHPADPEATETDRFFAEVYTNKLTLWSTGRFVSSRSVAILRGAKEIGGVEVLYLPGSESGHLPMRGDWFVADDGTCSLPIDLDPETVERSRQRLLNERRVPSPQGRRAHQRKQVVWFPDLPAWTVGAYDYTAPPCDDSGQPLPSDATTFKIRIDQAGKGVAMLKFRMRPAHQSLRETTRGWQQRQGFGTYEGKLAYSVHGAELANSVANAIRVSIGEQLDGVATPARLAQPSASGEDLLATRIERAEEEVARLEHVEIGSRSYRDESRGLLASAQARGSSTDEIQHELDACNRALQVAKDKLSQARIRLASLQRQKNQDPPSQAGPATTPLGVVAYMESALRRAAATDARLAEDAAKVIGEHFVDWRFDLLEDDTVTWSCGLEWGDGAHKAHLPLSGTVDNACRRRGDLSAVLPRSEILYHGSDIDRFLGSQRSRTKRHGVVVGLSEHLRAFMPSNSIGPLLDHPMEAVRRYVYRRLVTSQPVPLPEGWDQNFADHVLKVYTSGDDVRSGAAVPQRIDHWHALQLGLLHVDGQTTLDGVARAWNATWTATRVHLMERKAYARFAPFETVDGIVSLAACVHRDCSNTFASHLCALPEVTSTGVVALCPSCRRVPDLRWKHLVFPEAFVEERWTRTAPVVRTTESLYGPKPPASRPHQSPTMLRFQRQTVPWTGQRCIVPRVTQ